MVCLNNYNMLNKRGLSVGLVFIIFIIILLLIVGSYLYVKKPVWNNDINTSEQDEEKLNPEFSKWLEQYDLEINNSLNPKYDFNHPYLKCIFEGTCEGIFQIQVYIDSNENFTEIKKILSKYDDVRSIDEGFNWMKVEGIQEMNELFDYDFIQEIKLNWIKSNYSLNISDDELSSCNVDEDCIRFVSDCCHNNAIFINKKYEEFKSSLHGFNCQGIGCAASASFHWTLFADPKCIENFCKPYMSNRKICSLYYNNCNDYLPRERKLQELDENLTCGEIVDLCENGFGFFLNITNPIDESTIAKDSIGIMVETNNNAVCKFEYSKGLTKKDLEKVVEFKEVDSTGRVVHFQTIKDLQENYTYEVIFLCIDEFEIEQPGWVTFNVVDSLIVNITNPISGSNITTNVIELVVETNRNAVCNYAYGVSCPWCGGGGMKPKQMNITNEKLHSQMMDLEDEYDYAVTVSCIDEFGILGSDKINFNVRLL